MWVPWGGATGKPAGPGPGPAFGYRTNLFEHVRIGDLVWLSTKHPARDEDTWEVALVLNVEEHELPNDSPANARGQVTLAVAWLWQASEVKAQYGDDVLNTNNVPFVDAPPDNVWFLTDWEVDGVLVDAVAAHCEFVLGDEPSPDSLHRGAVLVPGMLLLGKGNTMKSYVPFGPATDVLALFPAVRLVHDQPSQLWRSGMLIEPAARRAPFDAITYDVIGLARGDNVDPQDKDALIVMGADPLAYVIHGIRYLAYAEGAAARPVVRYGFVVGHDGTRLRVRALHMPAELERAPTPAAVQAQLRATLQGTDTPSQQHWLHFSDGAEFIIGRDEMNVRLAEVLSPILVVGSSYLPLLLGEMPDHRLFVFELAIVGGGAATAADTADAIALVPCTQPSLPRRLDAVQNLVFPASKRRPRPASLHALRGDDARTRRRGNVPVRARRRHRRGRHRRHALCGCRHRCALPAVDQPRESGRGPMRRRLSLVPIPRALAAAWRSASAATLAAPRGAPRRGLR